MKKENLDSLRPKQILCFAGFNQLKRAFYCFYVESIGFGLSLNQLPHSKEYTFANIHQI